MLTMNRRPLLLAVAGVVVAIIIGRVLPRFTAPAASAPSVAPASSARWLAAAERGTSFTPLPPALPKAAPSVEPSDNPQEAFVDRAFAATRKENEALAQYQEAVIVQRPDGTTGVYRPEEWGDSEHIIARKFPDGSLGYYAGLDAGPRSDPAAFVPPHDEIEADGTEWSVYPDGHRVMFGRLKDAGAP
jgi:hypothetical protein